MKNLYPYAQLVRLPNTFTAMADIALGALATDLILSRWYVFLCLLFASTLLYWSGMIWNDYFDVTQDRKERPNRPLACGNVPMRTAFLLAIGCMAAALTLAGLVDVVNVLWPLNPEASRRICAFPIAVMLVVAIFLYNGVFKATFAGPILMGTCRFLNILLGLSILGAWPPAWGWLVAMVIGIYIVGVTWFARTEAQTSKQPMLIAAAMVMLLGLLLALTVPAVAMEAPEGYHPSLFFPYLLATFGVYLGVAILRAIRRPDPSRVQPVIQRAVLGLVILDALLVSAFVGSFGLLLVILLIPGIILGRWLYST